MSQDNKKDMSQYFFRASAADFMKIPGSPVAYWAGDGLIKAYEDGVLLGDEIPIAVGLQTGSNSKFVRFWPEVSIVKVGLGMASTEEAAQSGKKWFPYNKGGDFRKWYGNNEHLVNWEGDGLEIKGFTDEHGNVRSRPQNTKYYFRASVTWSFVSSSYFGVRYSDSGAVFDVGGSSAFPEEKDAYWVTSYLCSKQAFDFMKVMNPTLNFQVGNVSSLPIVKEAISSIKCELDEVTRELVSIHREDWDSFEGSWGFKCNPLVDLRKENISLSFELYVVKNKLCIDKVLDLEARLNQLIFDIYSIEGDSSVPVKQVTLTVNPSYRYALSSNENGDERYQSDTLAELISYSIGCLMGRYSLDRKGLVYAHAGNQGFAELVNEGAYQTFPADEDGILPLTDLEWFPDDATNRFREFVATVWGEENLQQNLDFVAESLCLHAIKPKRGESAMDTIRRYLSTQFYKDHLKTYKKRPIYWLFSSGKQKAFECLVYLHRYNEGTLARMRTEYVIPLTAKLATYVDKLEQDKDASSSAAETKRLEKEIAALHKQQAELASFDEKLRHYADMRISLDLDDGVKVNYGKFGDLLANVKDVTGNKAD